ncbi:hypothetical protein [Nannocystis pusilla]|uniref:hypothetical protein n=1 Tax=Nannocystis pusilla TaxID=889268 RepID=UPI003B8276BA
MPAETSKTPPAATPADAPAAGDASLFASKDGLVAAPRPSGDGWECVEQTAAEPGQETTLIKCRHTDKARFFFLLAKDYAVPPDQVRSAEQLANEVFPATYQKLFRSSRSPNRSRPPATASPGMSCGSPPSTPAWARSASASSSTPPAITCSSSAPRACRTSSTPSRPRSRRGSPAPGLNLQ